MNCPDFISLGSTSIPHSFFENRRHWNFRDSWLPSLPGTKAQILRNAPTSDAINGWRPTWFYHGIPKSMDLVKRFNKFRHRTFNRWLHFPFCITLEWCYRNKGELKNLSLRELKRSNGFVTKYHSMEDLLWSHSKKIRKTFLWSFQRTVQLNVSICFFVGWSEKIKQVSILESEIHFPCFCFSCPLDVHSGRVVSKRKVCWNEPNDWKAVAELTISEKTWSQWPGEIWLLPCLFRCFREILKYVSFGPMRFYTPLNFLFAHFLL